MRSVDTNVLARWVLGDDQAQAQAAAEILSEPVFVPLTVLLELVWVLHKALGLSRNVAGAMIEQVLDLECATIEHAGLVRWAIGRFRDGADWGDMLHLVAASAESSEFVTFDRRFARRVGNDGPLAVRVLPTEMT